MGRFSVKQVDNYFLIPNLGIGGAAIKTEDGNTLLDTGYIISNASDSAFYSPTKVNNSSRNGTGSFLDLPSSFLNFSKNYVKSSTSNVQRDLGEGQLVRKLAHDYEVVKLLAAHNCRLNKEVRQWQRWLLATMPDTASDYLYHEPGRKVTMIGEALQLHRCKPVTDYQIYWNQSYNGTCYSTFPVTSTSFRDLRFLELRQRNVRKQGDRIHCSAVSSDTYISDKHRDIWHLHNMEFKKIKKYNVTISDDNVGLIRVAAFGAHLEHYQKELPPRMSLLKMLARTQEALEQLEDFRTHGKGSVLSGIGSLLGTAIHSLASGSSMIIRAIGAGLRDTFHGVGDLDEVVVGSIANATSTVISAGASGISKVLDSIGGPAGIILYILVIALYAYLFYSKGGRESPFKLQFGANRQTERGDYEKAPSSIHPEAIRRTNEQIDTIFEGLERRTLLNHPVINRSPPGSIRTRRESDSPLYGTVW